MGLAEGGNGGDAITKPVRRRAGRTAPPSPGEALRRRANRRVRDPQSRPGHPGWVPRNRTFPMCAGHCGAKRNGTPDPPSPVPRFPKAAPICLYSTPNGTGLHLCASREGGEEQGLEGAGQNVLDSQNHFLLKSWNRVGGLKGHAPSPLQPRVKLFSSTDRTPGDGDLHVRCTLRRQGLCRLTTRARTCLHPGSLPKGLWSLSFELAESAGEGAGSPSALPRRGCIAGGA